MTRDEALKLYESGFWLGMSYRQRAEFQMAEEKLCMPFAVFHEAMEKALGRPVYTHEFGLDFDGLRRELHGERGAPSIDEIIEMIPAEKRIVLQLTPSPNGSAQK